MRKIILLTLLFVFLFPNLKAQKIADGSTLNVDGFAVTFTIVNKESITINGKNFDRYKVSATLLNQSGKSFNIRLNNTPQVVTNIDIVELDCVNATGAKLTSKKIKLKLKPQNLNVTYWAYTKDGKYQSSTIPIVAGYYLDEEDSVHDEAIFIVPQGEAPDVNVRKIIQP
ncbi:hypothetical protein [Empedobacter brevis]|uniref:hypothetical protein n=1 Tax=Empedobacter brevis TaxID=247 RepID=UPI00289D1406|nr:hypothetical protein [Empedobacter brevis]